LKATMKTRNTDLPTRLKTTLRPYQVQGFQWLKFLDEFNFGGCLADDMGLGKTLQVIAFLLDQKKNDPGHQPGSHSQKSVV
jgi:SNF2 family DNA or RNA helicase